MQVLGIVLASMCIAIVATAFAIKFYLLSIPFKPVELSQREAQQLARKLERFEGFSNQVPQKTKEYAKDGTLIPEQYSEAERLGISISPNVN